MKFAYPSGSRPLDGYTIKRGIGIGGFGEVYFATTDAGKEVALKRIQRNLDVELRGVTQCLNLKHVNLITLWDVRFDKRGEAWVVMEYVSGESLKDGIDRNPHGMPVDEVNRWFRGMVSGVACLHDHGIVHRDLKPGNVFLDEGIVKIGDYGLSKCISCSRRSGQTESVGTFHYMAPEIGKGNYGKQIDVYALGIILFEMLTGRVPFDGETSQEIMMKHLTADPDLSGISEPYRRVIRRAMAKDPERRYSSVGEMLKDLTSGRSPSGPPEAGRKRTSPAASAEPPLVIGPDGQPPSETLVLRGDGQDIVLGDVKEVVPAQVVPAPAAAGQPPLVQVTNPEPIAKAVRGGWNGLVDWWNHANLSTPVKVVLLLVAALLVLINADWLVPLCVMLGALYLVYYGVRSILLAFAGARAASRTAAPTGQQVAPAARPPRYEPRSTKQRIRDALKARAPTESLAELIGSMLLAAAACGVLCLLMMLVGGQEFGSSVQTWSFYVWLTLTSVAGAWTVLALSKFWEGSDGDQVQRRFVMLVAGLVLGALAFYGANGWLMVRLPAVQPTGLELSSHLSGSMYAADGTPLLPAYLIYFAGLLAIVRWWKQADPLRRSRLSLWATGGCVLWAWVLDLIWHFPQPWGIMLAATMSVAVQLSSPWMSPKQRNQFRRQMYQT